MSMQGYWGTQARGRLRAAEHHFEEAEFLLKPAQVSRAYESRYWQAVALGMANIQSAFALKEGAARAGVRLEFYQEDA